MKHLNGYEVFEAFPQNFKKWSFFEKTSLFEIFGNSLHSQWSQHQFFSFFENSGKHFLKWTFSKLKSWKNFLYLNFSCKKLQISAQWNKFLWDYSNQLKYFLKVIWHKEKIDSQNCELKIVLITGTNLQKIFKWGKCRGLILTSMVHL